MNDYLRSPAGIILSLFTLTALVAILDFLPSGSQTIETAITNKTAQREQYYNAARNSHMSHRLYTEQDEFTVSKDFYHGVKVGDTVSYAISPIFKENNGYKKASESSMHVHSLRIFSGMIAPMLMLVAFLLAYKFPGRWSTALFVIQAVQLANLIYLIL